MSVAEATRSAPASSSGPEPTFLAIGLALISATSGTARGLLVPGLKLSDLLVVVLLIAVLLRWGGQWRFIDGLGVAVLLYAGIYLAMTLTNFASRPELDISLLPHEILGAPQYVLIYMLAYGIGQKSRNLMTWLRPSMLIACVMAVVAVLQVADVGPVRQFLAAITGRDRLLDPLAYQVYRGTAFFPSWHALGMYLCLHAVIAAVCLGRGSPTAKDKRLLIATLLLSGVGILTTTTATPALIYGVAVVAFLVSTRNVVWAFLGTAILVFTASFTPVGQNISERIQIQYGDSGADSILPKSFWFRVEVWTRDFLPLIQENVWTGYGPVAEDSSLFAHMESMYVSVLMQGGILLLLALALLLLVAFLRMDGIVRNLSRDEPSLVNAGARALRFIIGSLTLFMVIHPYLSDAGAAPMFFTSLGVVSGLAYGVRTGTVSRTDSAMQKRI